MSKNEIRKQQLSGFYADIELKGDSYTVNRSEIKEQVDEIEGQSPSYSENRDRTVTKSIPSLIYQATKMLTLMARKLA
jgi:hypothetical protein